MLACCGCVHAGKVQEGGQCKWSRLLAGAQAAAAVAALSLGTALTLAAAAGTAILASCKKSRTEPGVAVAGRLLLTCVNPPALLGSLGSLCSREVAARMWYDLAV